MYIFVSNPSIRSAQNPQGGDDVVLASAPRGGGRRGRPARAARRLGADGAGLL